jgi:hypothetical protein
MKMPEYQIEQDKDGWFISCEGWDLCRNYRHSSYEAALKEKRQWEYDDLEAMESLCEEQNKL